MKTKTKIISLFFMLYTGISLIPKNSFAQVSVNFQVFYDELSPYGTWVDNSEYGYVWVPNVAPGFSPYSTNGYWVFTDEGWTWVSNYPWGWAPFHYGRWYTDPAYGPMWVPDNEWGPGWVTWRRSEGYYGWAPIEPGISISIAYGNDYHVPENHWRFVKDRDFGRRDINNYYVKSSNNVTIINNSIVINNTRIDKSRNVTFNGGPDRTEVEKHVGKKINPVIVKESSKPGQNMKKDQLEIYKPQVQRDIATGPKPSPKKVTSLKDMKTSDQRKSETEPKKEQPAERKRGDQPAKEQPSQRQPADRPNKQQPSHRQPGDQPVKQQPSNRHPSDQPGKRQPSPKQHESQQNERQPSQPQHNNPPVKQPLHRLREGQPNQEQPLHQQQQSDSSRKID